jgi:putative Ca2+/H+ antiporter (TMEM165/GDT1 family)
MVGVLVVSFLLVFAVIGGTELIDRTTFAVMGLASRHKPGAVWAGASLAFVITTTLAVVVGTALLDALGGHVIYLRLGGGLFLLGYAAYLLLVPESQRRAPTGRSTLSTAFLLILLLELGDTTMIFTIVLVSTQPNPLVVGVAAALALIAVAGFSSLLGARLGARVEPAVLERAVVVILTIVGVLTIVYALSPGLLPTVGG